MVRKCRLGLPPGQHYPMDAYAWDTADVLSGPDIVLAGEVEPEEEEPEPTPVKRKEIKQRQKREVKPAKKLNIGKRL